MQEIKITEQEAGQRFDKLLGKYLNCLLYTSDAADDTCCV